MVAGGWECRTQKKVSNARVTVLEHTEDLFISAYCFFYACVGVLSCFACMCATCMQGLQRPEEGIRSPRTGVMGGY